MLRSHYSSVIALWLISTVTQAAEPMTVDAARQTISRSLPFIESEGVAWKEQRKCVTCHQVSNLVWTFHEGRRHGFEPQADQMRNWSEWSLNNAFGNNQFYRLTKAAVEKLTADGLAAEMIDKLRPLVDQDYVTEADYLTAIGERITPELVGEHGKTILQASAKPGVGPGADPGPSAVYSVMLRSGATAQTADPARSLAVVFEGLRATQQPDGLWRSSNQFLAMHRPKDETNVVNTMWIVWALAKHEPLPSSMQQARERALAAIAKAERGATTESLLLRALLTQKHDAPAHEKLVNAVLAAQRADGGWAWKLSAKASPESDPLTTGQVLYGLGTLGRDGTDPHVQRAWSYLSKTQLENGSWSIPWLTFMIENNKDHTQGDKVFSYWGTTWAALGMMNTLPQATPAKPNTISSR